MCYICGRSNCAPSLHSIEEQRAYEPAYDAFWEFLEIRQKCKQDYENRFSGDTDD